jgi:hypothetical protein
MMIKNKIYLGTLIMMIGILSSCSSSKEFQGAENASVSQLKRSEYVLMDRVDSKASSTKVWFLFIPFGGKSPEALKEKAYHRALDKSPSADGIIDPSYNYRKFSIPLIILNFNFRKMEMTGRPYRMKTEEELANSK